MAVILSLGISCVWLQIPQLVDDIFLMIPAGPIQLLGQTLSQAMICAYGTLFLISATVLPVTFVFIYLTFCRLELVLFSNQSFQSWLKPLPDYHIASVSGTLLCPYFVMWSCGRWCVWADSAISFCSTWHFELKTGISIMWSMPSRTLNSHRATTTTLRCPGQVSPS
jgi:hypothetical protein